MALRRPSCSPIQSDSLLLKPTVAPCLSQFAVCCRLFCSSITPQIFDLVRVPVAKADFLRFLYLHNRSCGFRGYEHMANLMFCWIIFLWLPSKAYQAKRNEASQCESTISKTGFAVVDWIVATFLVLPCCSYNETAMELEAVILNCVIYGSCNWKGYSAPKGHDFNES